MKALRLLVWLALAHAALVATAAAQTEHHWSEQYGNRSMLLSGTVIAGVSDLGAVFYNPARLARLEGPGFILNAKVYERKDVVLEDGLGENLDLKQSSFGGAPSLGAGNFKIPFLEGHTFTYSFLTRRRDDTDFYLNTQATGDLLEEYPGEEVFSGELEGTVNVKEEWIGLSWAHPLNDRVSVGLSTFVTLLDRRSVVRLDLRTLLETSDVAALLRHREFRYGSTGLIWKGGMAVDLSPIHLGLTVTTPRVDLTGDGSTRYEELLAGVDSTGDGQNDDRFVVNQQRDLPAEARSPWAVGAGVSWEGERVVIHLSAEWYAAVSEYTMMETETFTDQSTGEPLQYRVIDELRSVLNLGAGVEWKVSDDFSAFGSVASDKSAAPREVSRLGGFTEEVSNSTFQGNTTLVGIGASLVTSWFDVTTGVTFGATKEDLKRPINFPIGGGDPVFPEDDNARLKTRRFRFLLGISIPFLDKVGESETG